MLIDIRVEDSVDVCISVEVGGNGSDQTGR